MKHQLTRPCCALCAAMNYEDARDHVRTPKETRLHIIIAALAAAGFIAMFLA